ncbi:MAG: S41 family peptidase [Candidatus Paceibacterota bacterium]|jgi:carboxyl-terminal processing protease
MFYKNHKDLIHYCVLSVVILAASFGFGYYFGKNQTIDTQNINLLNKDLPTEIASSGSVDFAPFWKAWSILDRQYVSKKEIPDDQEKVWGAISGLAASMGDPYTAFFPPAESKAFEETISGEFSGVGMEIGLRDRVITVISPLKNTPAYNAGVKSGDKILEINGTSTMDMTVDKAVGLIRGKKGTTVELSLAREGGRQPILIKVVRDVIKIPTLDTEKRDNGIFIIRLYTFSANSPDLFRGALREFVESGADKLILDLRGNPGGYLEAAVDMGSWFLPPGKVIVREDSGGKSSGKIFRSKGYNIFNDKLKFVVLVDKGSASASEILAGALSEQGVAKLIGERTFGKGSVQELLPITPDTSLKITVARWLTPNGLSISEGGLKPDFEVIPTESDIKNNRDPVMEKAAELLLSGK